MGITALSFGALLLQSCSTATPADFVGEWRGTIKVREKLPNKKAKEYESPIELAIMPDPDNSKGLIVFYKSMPLKADIRGNKFVVREEERQKLSSLFMLLGLMAGKAAELSKFSVTGKLTGSETMKISWEMELRAGDEKGSVSRKGELRRTSDKAPLERLLSPQ
ncbi:MAG: hypothetical protein NZ989_06565 [Bacteroidia bacterium]|nr:hypothetical protein [Bacteroidia bacterium]MDW8058275.1 hypothetical protein [Bacteroidia bacterium]